jgi:hypothetical protein
MSISNNFPNIRPTLNLDFANTEQLDPRITFTRDTGATYYDGKTFAKAEENLLLQSQDFTTSWANVGSTDSANTTTAPDGTSTADTLTEVDISSIHQLNQQFAAISGLSYTFSIYAKQGERRYLTFNSTGSSFGTEDFCIYDLQDGVITQQGASGSSSITLVLDGWYRCTRTVSCIASLSPSYVYWGLSLSPDAGRSPSYLGEVNKGLFLWGAQLEQRSSVTAYTPTTDQPITNYIPVLLRAPAGVPRFDHDPITGESLGLLIEESRTNLILNSEVWASSLGVVSNPNSTIAPDGTATSDLIIEAPSAGEHYGGEHWFTPSVIGTKYTWSVFVKQGVGSRRLYLRVAAGNVAYLAFNPVTREITSPSGAQYESSGHQELSNGYSRVWITWRADNTTSTVCRVQMHTGATFSYTGDGTSGFYVWGRQLEEGAFPTSYIKTEASQVTRSADSASVTGANFSSWYRQDEGTMYGESSSSRDTGTKWPFGIDDGSSSNVLGVRFTSTQVQNRVFVFGVPQADIVVAHTTGYAKTSLGYKFNDVAASVNGGAVGTDTSANIPVVSQLSIGRISGGSTICGHIRKLSYYPKRLTNSQLQALTG